MKISIIIPVYNDVDNLRRCLLALQKQTWPADDFEILVVDNGSEQKLDALVHEFKDISFLEEPTPGSYAARNKAIAQAKGDVWAFLDSDIKADPDWLKNGTDALLKDQKVGLVGGRIEFAFIDEQNPTAVELFDSLTSFKQKAYIEKQNFSVTGNLFSSPEVFEKIGLFNKDLKSGGDREWGNRVHNAGYKLLYADNAVVYHPARNVLVDILKKHRRVAGGMAQKLLKQEKIFLGLFLRSQIEEVLIFLFLCKEFILGGKVPARKVLPVLFINLIVSLSRVTEPYRILLGGRPIR